MRSDGSRNGLMQFWQVPISNILNQHSRPSEAVGSSVRTRTISAVQPDGPGAEPLTIWQIILTKPSSASTVTYNLPQNTNSVQNTQNNTKHTKHTKHTNHIVINCARSRYTPRALA